MKYSGEIKRLSYEMESAKLQFDYWFELEIIENSCYGAAGFQQDKKEKNCQYWRGIYEKYRKLLGLAVLEAVMAGGSAEQVREAILAGRRKAIEEK